MMRKKWMKVALCLSLSGFLASPVLQIDDHDYGQMTAQAKNKLIEPTSQTHCALCNMIVYRKNQSMGAFTGQAFTKNGKRLFFDDAGCMIVYELKYKKSLTKYVRDYNTKKWVNIKKATIVKANVTTPMHYGYAYFATKKSAQKYVKSHKGAKISSYKALKKDAQKRPR